MNIGVLSSLSKSTRLDSAGGTEMFCALLALNLGKQGHTVYLFASADSSVTHENVKLIPVNTHSMADIKQNFYTTFNRDITGEEKIRLIASLESRTLLIAKEHEDMIDIFHDNTSSPLTGSASNLFNKPFVTTMHLPPTGYTGYIELPPLVSTPTNNYVSISKWQQAATKSKYQIYNGIDISNFTFSDKPNDNLIWIGRISSTNPKGLKEAITAANQTDKQLNIQGSISDKTYFEQEIKPLLRDKTVMLDPFTSKDQKKEYFTTAKAFVFPALWEEPFPFVVLESFASGTPIIAYAMGSLNETIIDGQTGFLVNPSEDDIRGDWIIKETGIQGLCKAIELLYSLPEEQYKQMRRTCYERVRNNFTAELMVSRYLEAYENILSH